MGRCMEADIETTAARTVTLFFKKRVRVAWYPGRDCVGKLPNNREKHNLPK